uniref:Uncharacterized protein n=1 Tax=Arundo donax TaxID=35708 RepID=A0A0A9E6E9_ARUDO
MTHLTQGKKTFFSQVCVPIRHLDHVCDE